MNWWISSFIHLSLLGAAYTQVDFDAALDRKNLVEIKRILRRQCSSHVDPSVNYNAALILACKRNDPELVGMLLKDHRVDPTALNNKAIIAAKTFLNHEVLLVFLRDGRVPFDPVYELPRYQHFINPKIRQLFLDIPLGLLYACSSGDLQTMRSFDTSRLREEHLSMLIDRARKHTAVVKLIRVWQLMLLGAPESIEKDHRIIDYIDSFGNIPLSTMKRLIRARLNILSLGSHLVSEEVSNHIASYFQARDYQSGPKLKVFKKNLFDSAKFLIIRPIYFLLAGFLLLHAGCLDLAIWKGLGQGLLAWFMISSLWHILRFNNLEPASTLGSYLLGLKVVFAPLYIAMAIILIVRIA